MSNISFDLSGKIDQQTVAVLSIVKKVADALSIPFFVVGASARDIILNHCYGLKTPRMTKDIDLGIEIEDWEQFNQLKESLLLQEEFTTTSVRHRLRFESVLIDIVPFGAITDERRRISWPPEHEIIYTGYHQLDIRGRNRTRFPVQIGNRHAKGQS
jgi:predicted nucleotidyltransferase